MAFRINNLKKTIFILGSNSFSGSNFVKLLLDKGYKVIGVSRSKEYNPVYLPYKKSKNIKNFKLFSYDLNKQLLKIVNLFKKYKPIYVVNFAAQGMVNESWLNPEHWYNTNVLSQVKLLNKLRTFKYIKKYLQVTTPEVYGSFNAWKLESNIFKPSTPYAISRASLDMHLLACYKVYKFPVVFTRTANVFGPGQQLYRIIPKTIMKTLIKKKLELHGGGLSKRSFIYIDDSTRANFKVLMKGKTGETYHISTKKIISIKTLVQKIIKKGKMNFKDLVNNSKDRRGKDHSYKLNNSKLRKELGWNDKIPLDRGIDLTFDWIINNFKYLKNESLEYKHKK